MVYLVGTIGFFGGFALALQILGFLLKDRSARDLLEDQSLKWTYGLLAWFIAGISAYASVQAYTIYFG